MFKHNAKIVLTSVKNVGDKLIALKPVRVHVPVRFTECGLAQTGTETYFYGIYALIDENDNYGVSNICTMLKSSPSKTTVVKIDGTEYYEFLFMPGDAVIDDVNAVARDQLLFNVVDEFFLRGSVPWYYGYDHLGEILESVKEFVKSPLGDGSEAIEILAAAIARVKTEKSKYFRTSLKTVADLQKLKPYYVPLKSVFYSATNTTNKLAGNYFNDGITSALVNPTEKTERIESLLRA